MKLKLKVSKADYEKLDDAIKALYVAEGDDYVLEVEGYKPEEDNGALKRAKDRESQLRKEAEQRAKEAEERLSKIEGDDARKRGDIDLLEKSWKDKQDKTEKEFTERLSKKDAFIREILIDGEANKIANKISTSPSVMLLHVMKRLSVDMDGDKPATRVLDANGNPSAMTLEDLEKEFVANKDFSGIIKGSQASGSGTPSDKPSFRSTDDGGKPIDLATLNPKEFAARLEEIKEG